MSAWRFRPDGGLQLTLVHRVRHSGCAQLCAPLAQPRSLSYAGTPSTCVPNVTDVDTYTSWVSASVSELVVRRGFSNIDTLVFFTEPLSYDSGVIPPGYTQETFYAVVLRALHTRLVEDGVRSLVQIMAPNDGGISTPSMTAALQWTVSTLNDYVDVYSSHDYNMADYSAWFEVLSAGEL